MSQLVQRFTAKELRAIKKRWRYNSEGHVDIFLYLAETEFALPHGQKRRDEDQSQGLPGGWAIDAWVAPHEAARDLNEEDRIGILCEAAGSKLFGLLPAKGERGDTDVAGYQIRGSMQPNRKLLIHEPKKNEKDRGDDPNDVFILIVWVGGRSFRACGWMYGEQAQQHCYWNKPYDDDELNAGHIRRAYFVSQKKLNPMRLLPLAPIPREKAA